MPRRPRPDEPRSAEITPEDAYRTRREFIRRAGLFVATSTAFGGGLVLLSQRGKADPPVPPRKPAEKSGPAREIRW